MILKNDRSTLQTAKNPSGGIEGLMGAQDEFLENFNLEKSVNESSNFNKSNGVLRKSSAQYYKA